MKGFCNEKYLILNWEDMQVWKMYLCDCNIVDHDKMRCQYSCTVFYFTLELILYCNYCAISYHAILFLVTAWPQGSPMTS